MERDQHHCNSNSIHLPNISAALIVKCKRSRSNAFQQISRAVLGNSENERCNQARSFVYSKQDEFTRAPQLPASRLRPRARETGGCIVPSGGKRPGAGRKKGQAWHGAAPRDPSARELARSRVREVLTTASDPLAVLVEIANDAGNDVQVRVQAASAACPYIFPRLSAAVIATVPPASRDEHRTLVDRVLGKFEKMAASLPTIEAEAVCEKTVA
jgi:hypothetical protein